MAWESRGGRGLYYTRSRRVAGRVVRQYCGRGLVGEAAAAEDVRRRLARKAAGAYRDRVIQEQVNRLDKLEGSRRLGDILMSSLMAQAGYHLHRNTEWRKARERAGVI